MRLLRAALAAAFSFIYALPALAQGAYPFYGAATVGHAVALNGTPGGLVSGFRDAGTASTGTCPLNFNCGITDLPLMPLGLGDLNGTFNPLSIYDNQTSTGNYHSLTLGYVNGVATITANAAGSATQSGLNFNINGITYPIGSVGGMNIDASNATMPKTRDNVMPGSTTGIFFATDYLGATRSALCVWDGASGHDVGDCINAAIAAAAAAGGGTVYVPCSAAGAWYVSTPIVNHTSGVGLQVCTGPQIARDNRLFGQFLGTRLVWNGAIGATMFDNEPANPSTDLSLYRNDISAIFDCNNIAAVCAKISQTSNSTMRIGWADPTSTGLWFTTSAADAPGTQGNDLWLYPRCTNASDSHHPTCLLIDGGSGLNVNTSYDRIHDIAGFGNSGDAVVFGYSDTVQIDMIRIFDWPGLTTLGHRFVLANLNYTMPNGNKVNSIAGFPGNIQTREDGAGLTALGEISGLTFTNGGGNTGTATYTPFNMTINATVNGGDQQITVLNSSGVIAGDDIDCGVSSGINHYAVNGVVNGTSLQLVQGVQPRGVTNGTVCPIGIRPTNFAVAGGTYTISYSGTYSITAPSGGHSQSGISVASGHLSFTDMIIPWAGTPQNGDTWTVVLGTPAVNFYDIYDIGNGFQSPAAEPGATGFADNVNRTAPKLYSANGRATCVSNWGPGICPTASGPQSWAEGPGVTTAALATFSSGRGQNIALSGFAENATGASHTLSGNYSRSGGGFTADHGRTGVDLYASGDLSVAGDAQIGRTVLRGTGAASGGSVRLTSDGAAAGTTNCVQIPDNTAYQVLIDVVGLDHSSVGSNTEWASWSGLLTRGSGAGTTALSMAATPTPITNGTVTGQAISATADTTNGCLNLTLTHPTNTDTWNYVARVQTVEVQ